MVQVEEFEDGILIKFRGSASSVETCNAVVQIWRNKKGDIVAIDVSLDDENCTPIETPRSKEALETFVKKLWEIFHGSS